MLHLIYSRGIHFHVCVCVCVCVCVQWSYGVVCWEVFSLGATPYPGVSNYDVPHYITSGKRLSRPPLCPQDM